MDFGALPPEINSARMYAGPGPASMAAAAAAWDGLATELHSVASSYKSIIAGLTTGRWLGPSSLAMASAFGPFVAWTAAAGARAAEAAGQASLAVEAYEAAFTMTIPPAAVAANRVQLATLMATNFFGQNSAAIAANEAAYGEMWAQDAAAMYQYAANSAAACDLTRFTAAPDVVAPSGPTAQTAAVAQATSVTISSDVQSALSNLVSTVPTALQGLTSPASVFSSSSIISGVESTLSSFQTNLPYALPSYFMAAATPLYGMSSVLGIAQTAQGMINTAAAAASSAATQIASGVGSAAAGIANAVGPGVLGTIGTASALGPVSVPASWTSVIPTANAATALPAVTLAGSHQPNMLGGLPFGRSGTARPPTTPRYGIVPTAMTRPPSAG
jgi:PPE-repeat protein